MASQTVYEAAHKGDLDFIKLKLDEEPNLLFSTDGSARMLIHWAALSGNLKLVSYLSELGSPLNPSDDTETTPLILASSAGHTEIVKFILEKEDDINHKTTNGHSALQYAASKCWVEICRQLLEDDADINIMDARGGTPLHRAASKGNLDVVKLFLEYIDKLRIDQKDAYGNTALHLSCEEDRQDVAILLVENGADIEVINREGKRPVDVCSIKLAKLLVSKINKQ